MRASIAAIAHYYALAGDRMYDGEPVTQLEHALQSAAAAEAAGAAPALIVAALLHDIGHLVGDRGETPTARGIDDRHEVVAARWLRPLFDDQELDARGSTGTAYWEGAVTAFEDGRRVGRGYLELTGYAGALRL